MSLSVSENVPGDMPALPWLLHDEKEPDGATYYEFLLLTLCEAPWYGRPDLWGAEVYVRHARIARSSSIEPYPNRVAAQEAAWRLAVVWVEGLRAGLAGARS